MGEGPRGRPHDGGRAARPAPRAPFRAALLSQAGLDIATSCVTAHTTSLNSVRAWQQSGLPNVGNDSHYKPSATCSAEDIQTLKDMYRRCDGEPQAILPALD